MPIVLSQLYGRLRPAARPLTAIGLTSLLWLLSALPQAAMLREYSYDALLQRQSAPQDGPGVRVVDIDRASLEQIGPWPWSREQLATVVEAIAAAKPKALALDILLAGPDERSPGALARTLSRSLAASDAQAAAMIGGLAQRLPDGDSLLADALRKMPAVLGSILDPEPAPLPDPGHAVVAPILIQGRPRLDGLWREDGLAGAHPILAKAAMGRGVLSLPGDADAGVRRVPLLVASGNDLHPGVALEAARLSAESSSYLLLDGPTLTLRSGALRVILPSDGMLRLRPRPARAYAQRSISAIHVLRDASALRGHIVLLGGSAPELGGLRPSPSGTLQPSVQMQADAVEQILRGDSPVRPRFASAVEAFTAVLAAYLVLTAVLKQARSGLLTATLALAWIALSWRLAAGPGLLLDPLLVPATAMAAYVSASALTAVMTRRREALIRRRFEQHLAPAVVQRIVEQPALLKLQGESRIVTALFTDIEGFTAMTERAAPSDLVSLLDRYIDGTSRIVVGHGGMVEKVVGDSLHCLFNAPLDLPDHPRQALACALALHAFTEQLRTEPDAVRLTLGRTRIGFETGPVIVGDIGGGRKLDYTAHGNAMNRAARLEAANKELGSRICVGAAAAAQIDLALLRPLGTLGLRGVEVPLAVFEPWPEDMNAEDQAHYSKALAKRDSDPAGAAALFEELRTRFPQDRVVERFCRLLRDAQG